ncbi:alpha/beta hydrolase [Pseudomonas gingeri]|uniref:Esterase family protein n=1 Tax=Pseudomonas gingeri TaxID=117681 RepID=A0A7Y8CK21_9PSED|nr:alpha/beta hydrolase-fold protein [Pseudomonas gingeri]NWB26671.1 esterase family protein [Pseudomonas gingeri]NWC32779.1 esterase family protein [Pseudomonas gingeri]NWD52403.1 esterase family protein [Pseudomonas gingeri]
MQLAWFDENSRPRTPARPLLAGLLLSLLLLCSVAPARADMGTIDDTSSIKSKILSKDVKYSVYLPPDYQQSTRSYPILYLLHGGDDGRYNDWFMQDNLGNLLDRLIRAGKIPAMIVVTPDALRNEANQYATFYMNDADGQFRWEDMFFNEFMPDIEKKYRVLKEKRFRAIGGLSMGGFGSLIYAFKHSDSFGAAAVMSAAVRTDEQIIDMDTAGYERRYGHGWGVGLQGQARINAHYLSYNALNLLKTLPLEDIRKTKYYLDCGTDDRFFTGNSVLHAEMNKLGVPNRFSTRPGEHNYDFWTSGSENMLTFVGRNFQELKVFP